MKHILSVICIWFWPYLDIIPTQLCTHHKYTIIHLHVCTSAKSCSPERVSCRHCHTSLSIAEQLSGHQTWACWQLLWEEGVAGAAGQFLVEMWQTYINYLDQLIYSQELLFLLYWFLLCWQVGIKEKEVSMLGKRTGYTEKERGRWGFWQISESKQNKHVFELWCVCCLFDHHNSPASSENFSSLDFLNCEYHFYSDVLWTAIAANRNWHTLTNSKFKKVLKIRHKQFPEDVRSVEYFINDLKCGEADLCMLFTQLSHQQAECMLYIQVRCPARLQK